MKRNLTYILIGCFALTLFACSDNVEDATSKHVYGENENPYLRTNLDATVSTSIEYAKGHFEPLTIRLDDYAEKFQKHMNMTTDQVINGLKDGTVVFYNINTNRACWNKEPMTKGTTGWYYNSAGAICSADDPMQAVSLDLNTETKTLHVIGNEEAIPGTVLTVNVGFAVNGPDYDDYVRFLFNVTVSDPSIIVLNINIPDGNYASYSIDFNKYAETIEQCMGMSLRDFLDNMDHDDAGRPTGKSISMYVINPSTGEWDTTSTYTAEDPGYWMNAEGAVCEHGATGYSIYANTKADSRALLVGRAPGLSAGNKYTISVGYRDTENENNFFRFIINATLE